MDYNLEGDVFSLECLRSTVLGTIIVGTACVEYTVNPHRTAGPHSWLHQLGDMLTL